MKIFLRSPSPSWKLNQLSLMCFYNYFPYLKQTITILLAYDLVNSFRKSPLNLKSTLETRPWYVNFAGFLHPKRGRQRDNQPMTDEVIIRVFQISLYQLQSWLNKSPFRKSYWQTLKTLAHHMQETSRESVPVKLRDDSMSVARLARPSVRQILHLEYYNDWSATPRNRNRIGSYILGQCLHDFI